MSAFTSTELRAALKQHFGLDDFRGRQEEAIRAVLEGRDVLLTMPTSALALQLAAPSTAPVVHQLSPPLSIPSVPNPRRTKPLMRTDVLSSPALCLPPCSSSSTAWN